MAKSFKRGAPTKYKPEYVDLFFEYLNQDPYDTIAGRKEANDYKSKVGFACVLGVHRDTLHEWSRQHAEFKEVYDLCEQYQERYLLVNGLRGLINSQFAQFTAINHLDYRNKPKDEVDTIVQNSVSNLTDEQTTARIKELIAKMGKDG